MSTCAVVRSFIESKCTEIQTLNVGFTSEVSDYLVVHTGSGHVRAFDEMYYNRGWVAAEETVVIVSGVRPLTRLCNVAWCYTVSYCRTCD